MLNILVCTSGNILNFKKTFESIKNLSQKIKINLIIIDNSNKQIIKKFIKKISFKKNIKIYFKVERKIGIPYARNSALNLSKNIKSSYTAFIDDDCIFDKNWLNVMLKCISKKKYKIITGPQITLSNNIFQKVLERNEKHLSEVNWAATNNLFLDSSILKNSTLRFDEKMHETGGSDQLFSMFLSKNNKILWNSDAKVYEMEQVKRNNFKWFLKRNLRYGTTSNYIYTQRYGYLIGSLYCAVKLLKEIFLCNYFFIKFFLSFNNVNFYFSVMFFIRSIGTFLSFFGFSVSSYKY